MSRRGSISISQIAVGLVIGAAAVALYRRRSTTARITTTPAYTGLPSGSQALTTSGGSTVPTTSDRATKSGALASLQHGPGSIIAQIQSYIQSARQQLDVAIAEGQTTAARTRQDLEARFVAAKKDPDSARRAFV